MKFQVTEKDLIAQIEKEYTVCNVDRDKFWDAFINDLLGTKDENGDVSSVEFGSRLWSAIMQGYLRPKGGM